MSTNTAKYHFDSQGRLIEETFPDGSGRQFTYDAAGNQILSAQIGSFSGSDPITVAGFAKKNGGDFLNNAMLVMLSNGEIVGWGDNTTGVLANGIAAATNQPPQRVLFDPNTTLPPSDATIVDWTFTNANLYVVFSNGWAYSAGKNAYGQLGHGDTVARPYLKRIESFVAAVQSVIKVWASGARSTTDGGGCVYFQSSDYSIFGCGANAGGNLGNGGTVNQTTPVVCEGVPISPTHVVDVAISCASTSFSVYMLMSDGKLYVAGYNAQGQLGTGDTVNKTTFTAALLSTGGTINFVSISANAGWNGTTPGGNALGIDNNGDVWTTGYNGHGELGLGNTTNQNKFTKITAAGISNIVKAELGCGLYGVGYAINAAGMFYTWGYNGQNNQFKNNATTPQSTPSLATFLPGLASQVFFPKGNYLSTNSQLLVLTTSGRLVYAGVDDGQLPVDSAVTPGAYSYIRLPRSILQGLENIVDVFVHGTSTTQRYFLLTDTGNLYACGNNTDALCVGGISSNVNAASVSFFKLNLVLVDG